MFDGFRVFSRWPPNHVTYQEQINKLEKGPLGEYMCKVSPQSVQPFWRRRIKKIYLKTRWLSKYVTDDVTIIFFFDEFMSRLCSKNFRFFSHAVLLDEFSPAHLFTDDVTKNHTCSPSGA